MQFSIIYCHYFLKIFMTFYFDCCDMSSSFVQKFFSLEYVSLDLKSHEAILEMLDDKSVRDNNLPSVCEFGLEQCSLNEECVLQSFTPSRQGTCQCLPSFKRDSFGICQPEPVSFTSPPPGIIFIILNVHKVLILSPCAI